MSRRKTKCFTYGEVRSECIRIDNGIATFSVYVTACRRTDVEDVEEVPNAPVPGPRPKGVCPHCWADWRRANTPTPPEEPTTGPLLFRVVREAE